MILKDVTVGLGCHDLPIKKLDYRLEKPAFMAVDKTRNMELSGTSVSRTKATKTSLAFHAIFNGFYLKNKAGLTGNFVRMKNSYKRREQL